LQIFHSFRPVTASDACCVGDVVFPIYLFEVFQTTPNSGSVMVLTSLARAGLLWMFSFLSFPFAATCKLWPTSL
jgi:hypothetical protein